MTHVPSTRSRQACTRLAAVWCPVHGDCTCPEPAPGDLPHLDSKRCPLHSSTSTHAEPVR